MKNRFGRETLLLCFILLAAVGCGTNPATSSQTNPQGEATLAPANTLAPVNTGLTPAAAVTATASPTATRLASSAAGGSCDMPYFPVRAGATWKYRYVASGLTTDETFDIASVSANGFTRRITFSNIPGSSEEQWSCSSQGLSNPQMSNLTTTAGGSTTQVRVLNHAGISLPPAEMWKVGTSWSESAKLEETIAIGGKAGSPVQATVDETNKIVGQETLTIPAGTFSALRVDSTLAEHLGQTNLSVPFTSWYAQSVGLVKVQASAVGATVTVELVSYTP